MVRTKKQTDEVLDNTKPVATEKQTVKTRLKKILDFHNKKLADEQEFQVDEQEKACFQYIANTSGGPVMLLDFHAASINPETEKCFKVKTGEKLNLLSRYDVKDINRNRQCLITAASMPGIYGLPAITFIESLKVEFPIPLVRETLWQKAKKRAADTGEGRITTDENEFDERFREVQRKEEDENRKVEEAAGMKIPEKRMSRKEREQKELNKL